MNEQERELDLMVAELEQENRLLRARNDRLESEAQDSSAILESKTKAIQEMGAVLVDYEQLIADMAERIKQLESKQ